MKKMLSKKLVLAIVMFAFTVSINMVAAQTVTDTPTSMYHTPTDTGIGDAMDNTLIIGAALYGVGVLFTSGAKVIGVKFGGAKLLKG